MRKVDIIKSYYENNMKNASQDYEVLGWESEEAQKMRFDMLVSNVALEGKRILDVGCGLGNLLEYINNQGIPVDYTGIDVLPEMIERAKKKGLPGEFLCADLFKENPFGEKSFDVIYASGIFNLNLGNNKEFLASALTLFIKLARKSLCFNLLHCNSTSKEDTYYYFCPDQVIRIIEEIWPDGNVTVQVIEQYLQNDFTVICSVKE